MSQIPNVWVEAFDVDGNRLGKSYIRTVESVTIDRPLDEIGEFSFQVPSSDPLAVSLLSEEVRVRVYAGGKSETDDKRLLVSGIIRSINASDNSNSWSMICSGPNDLDELTRYNLMLGLEYNQANHTPDTTPWDVEEIVDDLVGNVAGWTTSITSTETLAARFDGMNIIEALDSLHETTGNHFRPGTTAHSIEFGSFGTSNGVSLIQRARGGYNNDPNKLIIESVNITGDSYEVVNKLVPLGATSGGDTSLTLESVAATRGTAFGDPFDIISFVRNGVTHWAIEDPTSQAAYGVIEDIKTFDQIQVQSGNSEADIIAAANALYDAVAYYLTRRKDKLTQYAVTVTDPQVTIRAGDKIHMAYKGFIEKVEDDGSVTLLPPRDINQEFWVLEANEQWSSGGSSLSLTLSTVDYKILTDEEIIVGAIRNARIDRLSVKSYTNIYTIPFSGAVDDSNDVTVDLLITSRMQKVRSVILRLETLPFEAYSQSAAANGDHRHKVASLVSAAPFNSGALGNMKMSFASSTATGTPTLFNTDIAMSLAADWFTEGASDNHTHDLEYGLFRDTSYPANVTVSINGVDRTVALGGSWGTVGAAVDLTDNDALDITQYITDESVLQKNHPIVLGCGSGQGIVKGVIEVYVDIQNLG